MTRTATGEIARAHRQRRGSASGPGQPVRGALGPRPCESVARAAGHQRALRSGLLVDGKGPTALSASLSTEPPAPAVSRSSLLPGQRGPTTLLSASLSTDSPALAVVLFRISPEGQPLAIPAGCALNGNGREGEYRCRPVVQLWDACGRVPALFHLVRNMIAVCELLAGLGHACCARVTRATGRPCGHRIVLARPWGPTHAAHGRVRVTCAVICRRVTPAGTCTACTPGAACGTALGSSVMPVSSPVMPVSVHR